MIVLKFGGTSVQTSDLIDRAISIAYNQKDRHPILIASASGKTTDRLVEISEFAGHGNGEKAFEILHGIKVHHYEIADAFLSGTVLSECRKQLDELFVELESLVKGLYLLQECTPRSTDTLLSFGERLSTTLIAYRGKERGIDTVLLDSRLLIKTDDNFTSAIPDLEKSYQLINQHVTPVDGRLYVGQGFIGSNDEDLTTTLGRGGSDFTATIYGAGVKAEEVQIWTDVDGIMTADPRVIEKAHTIPEITYQEAAELAYFGAKVVHPSTIQPAVGRSIPVLVKNTKNPDGAGTAIIETADNSKWAGVRAIATKTDITLITINSSRMLNAYGFLSKIFSIFEAYKISVDLIATSEVSVSLTVDTTEPLENLISDLESIGEVSVETDKGIISMVGQDVWKKEGIIVQAFTAMKDISIRLITMGSSDINLSVVISTDNIHKALAKLHQSFFE